MKQYKPKKYTFNPMKIKSRPMSFVDEKRPLVKRRDYYRKPKKTSASNSYQSNSNSYQSKVSKQKMDERDSILLLVGGVSLLVALLGILFYLLGLDFLTEGTIYNYIFYIIGVGLMVLYVFTFMTWENRSIQWKLHVVSIYIFLVAINMGLFYNDIWLKLLSIIWLTLPFIIDIIELTPYSLLKKHKEKTKPTDLHPTGYIYAVNIGSEIKNCTALKIGKTVRTPQERLREYRTGNPYSILVKSWICYGNLNENEKQAHNIASQLASFTKQEVFYFHDNGSIYKMFDNINTFMIDLEENTVDRGE